MNHLESKKIWIENPPTFEYLQLIKTFVPISSYQLTFSETSDRVTFQYLLMYFRNFNSLMKKI